MDARPSESAPALPALPPLASTLRCASPSAEPPPPASAGPGLPHASSAASLTTVASAGGASVPTIDDNQSSAQQSNDQLSSILFGIPDRSATASAPPDLEISSRSLFAFKAGYSGIFSDIRTDDYYESFYNENPERLNLPPPLPTDTPRYSHQDDQLQRQPSGRRPPAPPSNHSIPIPRRPSPRPIGTPAPSPPVQPNSTTTDVEATHEERQAAVTSSAAQIHQQQQLRYMAHQQQRQHVPVQDATTPLWASLNHLTLDEMDGNGGGATALSPRRMYPQAAYPPSSSSALNYMYATQPGSPLEHQQPLFESPPPQQQRWLDGMYDPAPQDYGAYRGGNGREDLDVRAAYSARALYPLQSHQQQQRGRRGGGGGAGRSRGHNNSPFNYLYASRAAASVVVAPPNSNNYLDAQAAAAAAAAAAAVYKNGGVHINGTGSFGSGGSGSGRVMRGGGGKGNRGMKMNDHHRDSYRSGGRDMRNDYRDSDDSGNGGASGSRGGNGLNNNNKLSSFNDIIGRAEELARDQHGCRFLQTKLEEGNAMYINSIFEECYEKFVDLMTDPFGNYLCQKLFEHCNDAQRLALVERCAPAFPRVSTNMHGTRAVQRMVECLSTPRQVEAVCKALAPAAVALMKDINGNHVIQRCLHRMDPAHNQFVYDAVASHCFELATHRHGCCVMQRCMDYASPAQRNQLAKQINKNALPLVQNAFGNYVVQYVLGLNDPTYTAEVIRRLRGHVAELSMQKFSSNVVEKGLLQGARDLRQELIFELIEDQDTMRRLLHDAYGNYVIQRALQVAESPQLEHICEAIRPHLNSLRQSPYGKRIQAKIQKRMPKCLPASIASN